MMYGGVAQSYCLWKMDGEPYKKNNVWYVKMINPITKLPKEVRWYTDKKHAELMPHKVNTDFVGKIFGFENADDYILCIRDRDLSAEECDKYFNENWKTRGTHWRFGMFFGGVWYTDKKDQIPPIKNEAKIFRATWPEFVKAGQANTRKLRDGAEDGFWFKEAIA